MLLALTRGKGRYFQCGYGWHHDHGVYLCDEPELISMIFGSLSLLPPELIARFWVYFLRTCVAPNVPDTAPAQAHMNLWPERSDAQGHTTIMPDAHVRLIWPHGKTFTLLIETEWNHARVRDPRQLYRQWSEYLSAEEQQSGWHLYIGHDTSAALREQRLGNIWAGRLIAINWFAFLGMLLRVETIIQQCFDTQHELTHLLPWTSNVIALLERLGVRTFEGFRDLPEGGVIVHQSSSLFWREYSGFAWLRHANRNTLLPTGIFFTSKSKKGITDERKNY
ncbi:hypothetical protein [Chrysiogenes arsenatis]|uniref:hypothetical protein n=1 Tax=Chrysiogenes arsenatis TaxID=309797 RepID=UPI000419E497|nr:hypothetical protein [Chrysiogenes arsenatis]